MIVDMHTHTFPDHIAAGTLEKLSAASHTRPFTNGTQEGLLRSMEEAGVDLSLVLPVATAPRQVERINDRSAQLNQSGGKLLSFGCMHPDFPGWREELLVTTHAGDDVGFPGAVRCSPEMVRRAVEQVGPVTLILAHMGGWRNWDRVETTLASLPVFLDTSFSTGRMAPLDDGYYQPQDLELLDPPRFMKLLRAFGIQRVLFGSDSPWSGQKQSLEWLRALPLSQGEQRALLGGTAERLLGLG